MKNKDERKTFIKSGVEHETRVLLENIHSDVKKISENQSLANNRLDKIEEKVAKIDAIETELGTVKLAVMETSKKVNVLNNKVNEIDTRLTRVEKKLDQSIDNHEKRITKIEEKVFV